MTDAEYWSIANALPKSQIYQGSTGYVWNLDWRSALPGCDQTQPLACSFVRGWNPITNCWVDPGAQYVTPPSPYPSPSSWGVPLCNPPITQPPPSGGGTTSSGGGTTSSGGSGSSGPSVPNCPSVFLGSPSGMGAWDLQMQTCHPPPTTSACRQSQVMVSGQNYVKYDCTQTPGLDTNVFGSIPTWVYIAGAGLLLFMFLKR